MSAATVSIRDKRVVSASEVAALLSWQTLKDAREAGWLRPVCTKENNQRDRVLFAMADVRAVEDRLLSGEYPGQEKGGGE